MIQMRVRRDNRRQPGHAVPSQERHHDTPSGIALRSARTAVDQHPAVRGTAQGHRIALANVQESYGEA